MVFNNLRHMLGSSNSGGSGTHWTSAMYDKILMSNPEFVPEIFETMGWFSQGDILKPSERGQRTQTDQHQV